MSRDNVAWVTSMPLPAQPFAKLFLAGDGLLLDELGDQLLSIRLHGSLRTLERMIIHVMHIHVYIFVDDEGCLTYSVLVPMNIYSDTVRVGVAGATGYSGVELLRLLARHPHARIAAAMGAPGAPPRRVPALARLWDATVDGLNLDVLAADTDAVFLALPDEAAAEIAPELLSRGKRVFDLSGAFRLRDAAVRHRWYPRTPEPPASLAYGLTERYRQAIAESRLVACAGCYPTAAILALQPLVQAGLIEAPIIIDAKSGVSGAGKTPTERTHFQRVPRQHLRVWRVRAPSRSRDRAGARHERDVRAAPRPDRPRHLRDDLRAAASGVARAAHRGGVAVGLRGVAVRAAHRRRPAGGEARRAHELLRHRLARRRGRPAARDGGCLDNLVKGAAGQAVQNFNVAFGFDERLGPQLTRRCSSSAASCSRTRPRASAAAALPALAAAVRSSSCTAAAGRSTPSCGPRA